MQPPWWQTLPTTIVTNHEIDYVEGIIWSWGSKRKGDGKGVRGEKWETKLGVSESNGWKRKKNV